MKGSDSATLHPFNLLRPNLTRRLASCLGARVPAKPQLTQRPQYSAGETTPLCTGSGRTHNSPIFLIPLHCWAGCTVITSAYSNHLHCTVYSVWPTGCPRYPRMCHLYATGLQMPPFNTNPHLNIWISLLCAFSKHKSWKWPSLWDVALFFFRCTVPPQKNLSGSWVLGFFFFIPKCASVDAPFSPALLLLHDTEELWTHGVTLWWCSSPKWFTGCPCYPGMCHHMTQKNHAPKFSQKQLGFSAQGETPRSYGWPWEPGALPNGSPDAPVIPGCAT